MAASAVHRSTSTSADVRQVHSRVTLPLQHVHVLSALKPTSVRPPQPSASLRFQKKRSAEQMSSLYAGGDISPKPRRLQIYADSDCGEHRDGFCCDVLRLPDPEHPQTLSVQYVPPAATPTSSHSSARLLSLSLMCQQVCT
ncbi:Hypothetical predicted protein, partial [Xyrichtys novacula]